jgi:uridine kinase
MKSTGQIKGMHTMIRDATTDRADFIFYSERLSCLVVEQALAEIPHVNVEVTSPTGDTYKGLKMIDNVRLFHL